MKKALIIIAIGIIVFGVGVFYAVKLTASNRKKGDVIDRFNSVAGLIYSGHLFNKFGHVAIVSEVTDDSIEIGQQNPSRERINYPIRLGNGK